MLALMHEKETGREAEALIQGSTGATYSLWFQLLHLQGACNGMSMALRPLPAIKFCGSD